jgi:hypothetical protein
MRSAEGGPDAGNSAPGSGGPISGTEAGEGDAGADTTPDGASAGPTTGDSDAGEAACGLEAGKGED